MTIGRRPANEVALDWDSEVSRVHAALERAGDDWILVDEGLSHNGTYVGGERVNGRRRLRDGDVVVGRRDDDRVLRRRRRRPRCRPSPRSARTSPSCSRPAQRRVLVALCRPFREGTFATPATNQQIADELVVSVDAVKSNLRPLFAAFGVDDLPQNQKRASLAMKALRSGVISRREL